VATEYAAAQVDAEIEQGQEIIRQTRYVTDRGQFESPIRAACPSCGAAVGGGKFCPECGRPLSTEKFCTECGSKIPEKAKFCPECGAKQA
jgi:RNA polymerase subunit RPABC4/transcription elongation factor Spt4